MPKLGFKHSPISRRKMSLSRKAHPTRFWLGKKRSEDTKLVVFTKDNKTAMDFVRQENLPEVK